MITGLVKTSYIAKNGNRLDAGYYLVGPRQVQRAERAVVELTAKVAAAKKRAEQFRIHMEKLRADGAVQIIEDSNKAEVEISSLPRSLKLPKE